jgi:hypothetical protein
VRRRAMTFRLYRRLRFLPALSVNLLKAAPLPERPPAQRLSNVRPAERNVHGNSSRRWHVSRKPLWVSYERSLLVVGV